MLYHARGDNAEKGANGMKSGRKRHVQAALCVAALCAAASLGYHAVVSNAPQEGVRTPQVGSMDAQALIERGCVLHQTLTYTACGHSVERNVDAPDTVLGMNREVFEQAMSEYRLISFGAQRIEMARTMEIPCPAHWVIRAGEDGLLGVYRNLYGEALLCLRTLSVGVSAAPEADADALRRGLCFDTAQEAEAYLEAITS